MAEEETKELPKGTMVDIVAGKSSGMSGEVFWTGPNKYGPGVRYGVRDENGEAHWVDSSQVVAKGGADAKAPEPKKKEKKEPSEPAKFKKGQTVEVISNSIRAEIFWVGPSRYGDGHRYGAKDESGNTHWVDESEVREVP